MSLSPSQIDRLLSMISSAEADELDCDGCFDRVAEFVELHLASEEIPDAMRCVEQHLKQCRCCQDEFRALLKALAAVDDPVVDDPVADDSKGNDDGEA